MEVTHNNQQYTVTKLNDNEWKLTSASNQRDSVVMSRWQLHIAGLLEKVEGKV